MQENGQILISYAIPYLVVLLLFLFAVLTYYVINRLISVST